MVLFHLMVLFFVALRATTEETDVSVAKTPPSPKFHSSDDVGDSTRGEPSVHDKGGEDRRVTRGITLWLRVALALEPSFSRLMLRLPTSAIEGLELWEGS